MKNDQKETSSQSHGVGLGRPSYVQQLVKKVDMSLIEHQNKEAEAVKSINDQRQALASADVRTVTQYALRDGISVSYHSGQATQTALSSGAMLIASVLHREGVQSTDLAQMLSLWQSKIDSADLFAAAEQLLGPGGSKLRYKNGTPLAELSVTLFGMAHEPGDLIAAGGIINSVYRKLGLLENGSMPQ